SPHAPPALPPLPTRRSSDLCSLRPRLDWCSRPRHPAARPEGPLVALAHRMYARALFEAAQGDAKTEQVRDELDDLVASIEEVPELRAVLENPEIDAQAKAAILGDILGQ